MTVIDEAFRVLGSIFTARRKATRREDGVTLEKIRREFGCSVGRKIVVLAVNIKGEIHAENETTNAISSFPIIFVDTATNITQFDSNARPYRHAPIVPYTPAYCADINACIFTFHALKRATCRPEYPIGFLLDGFFFLYIEKVHLGTSIMGTWPFINAGALGQMYRKRNSIFY